MPIGESYQKLAFPFLRAALRYDKEYHFRVAVIPSMKAAFPPVLASDKAQLIAKNTTLNSILLNLMARKLKRKSVEAPDRLETIATPL